MFPTSAKPASCDTNDAVAAGSYQPQEIYGLELPVAARLEVNDGDVVAAVHRLLPTAVGHQVGFEDRSALVVRAARILTSDQHVLARQELELAGAGVVPKRDDARREQLLQRVEQDLLVVLGAFGKKLHRNAVTVATVTLAWRA